MELNIHSRKIQLRLISSVNKTVTKYLSDLKERMGNILIAYDLDGNPVYAKQLKERMVEY